MGQGWVVPAIVESTNPERVGLVSVRPGHELDGDENGGATVIFAFNEVQESMIWARNGQDTSWVRDVHCCMCCGC